MRYFATVDGLERELEIEELSGRSIRLKLGEHVFEADVRRIGPSSISILIGDRSFDLNFVNRDEHVVVTFRGNATRVTLVDALRRRPPSAARAAGGGKAELKAMMPGRIVNILVKTGEEVAAHQGVVVVEAMKMENELKAPKAGRVAEIRVAPGQTVEKGELLIVIE
jgi:biotin carboxyl carrier protein